MRRRKNWERKTGSQKEANRWERQRRAIHVRGHAESLRAGETTHTQKKPMPPKTIGCIWQLCICMCVCVVRVVLCCVWVWWDKTLDCTLHPNTACQRSNLLHNIQTAWHISGVCFDRTYTFIPSRTHTCSYKRKGALWWTWRKLAVLFV